MPPIGPFRVVTKSHVSQMKSIGWSNALEPAFGRKNHKTFDGCGAFSLAARSKVLFDGNSSSMSPTPAGRRDICLARSARRREHDPTILLFSLTCSMAYSMLARAFPGGVARSDYGPRHIHFEICLTASRERVASKWVACRAQATTADRALVAGREMADVDRVYLDGLRPWPQCPTVRARGGRSRVGRSRQSTGASFCYRQTCWPLTTTHRLEGSCGCGGGRWGTLVTTGARGGLGAGGAGRIGSVGGVGA
jgi:hypothetical protein